MKATGIVRPVDKLGRVVLPKELRTTYNIHEGDPLEILTNDNEIILRKYTPCCIFCGEIHGDDLTIDGITICRNCAERITALKAGKSS